MAEGEIQNVGLAFGICIGAGLATAIGSALPFVVNHANPLYLALSLALSAGVMLYVSFVEIFVKAEDAFAKTVPAGSNLGYIYATASFFGGMAFCALLDILVHWLHPQHNCSTLPPELLGRDAERTPSLPRSARGSEVSITPEEDQISAIHVPEPYTKDDVESVLPAPNNSSNRRRQSNASKLCMSTASANHQHSHPVDKYGLHRMGALSAAAIAIHNLPEGLATFMATLASPSLGASLAVAIAIHNIPEGICVALPIFYATGNRWKAFMWGTLSGVSEPIGALIGYGILRASGSRDGFSNMAFGIMFGMVGGIMVFISLGELLPTAHRYCSNSGKIKAAMVCGMAIMALSLVLFKI
ncbi:zinc transporter ZIP [Phlyctochytrium arcticum]|nr:zinc transporter ZIP [Phlyctochytrium arcticum]